MLKVQHEPSGAEHLSRALQRNERLYRYIANVQLLSRQHNGTEKCHISNIFMAWRENSLAGAVFPERGTLCFSAPSHDQTFSLWKCKVQKLRETPLRCRKIGEKRGKAFNYVRSGRFQLMKNLSKCIVRRLVSADSIRRYEHVDLV